MEVLKAQSGSEGKVTDPSLPVAEPEIPVDHFSLLLLAPYPSSYGEFKKR